MDLRWAMVWVAVAVTAVASLSVDARATYGARTTADEPQYLLTALSLGEDLDLDIADEIAAERYRPFSEVGLDEQTVEDGSGRRFSPHDPLLPALLAPSMRLGGWVLVKLTLAAVAGLLAALTLWVAVRRFDVELVPAALVVGAFGVTPPLVSYGTQVYPEVPAALAVTAAIAALTGPLRTSGLVVTGLALVALPWLGVKYVAVAAVLAALLGWRLWRSGRKAELARFVAAMVAAAIAYLLVHRMVYGGWTVYAAGDHFADTGELAVVGNSPDLPGRSRRLLGLIVDRGFGLAAWAPAYLLAIPAMAAFLRVRPRRWPVLVVTLAAGWLTATFVALTMHGWWWPGRQVVVVLPAAVVIVAWWAAQSRGRLATVLALGAVGLVGWLWLVVEASSSQLTLIVDFVDTANPVYRVWSRLLPDGQHLSGLTGALTVLWWLLAAGLAMFGWRSTTPPDRIGAGAGADGVRQDAPARDPDGARVG
jgi:hypothetical protein